MFKVQFLVEKDFEEDIYFYLSLNDSTSLYSKTIAKCRDYQYLCKCSDGLTYKKALNRHKYYFALLMMKNEYHGKIKSCYDCNTKSYIIYNNNNNKLALAYYKNNILKHIDQYINNKRNEKIIKYCEYGNILEVTNKVNEVKNGREISYWSNGNIQKIVNWLNNEKNGIELIYFENGDIEHIINWVNNKKNGIEVSHWSNDIPVSISQYQLVKWGIPQKEI
jgi:hypothetical protein